MNNKISAVVLDWAGTTIDFGCQLPVIALSNAFKSYDVNLTKHLIRKYIGLSKRNRIEQLLKETEVETQFYKTHQREYNSTDLDKLLAITNAEIISIATTQSVLIPGMLDFQNYLHEKSIKIASNTGYTRNMMKPILEQANIQGYRPDLTICSDEIELGKPFPHCSYLISQQLNTYPLCNMVKIGDSLCDIKEGINSCMWTIGVAATGNMLGLTENEFLNIEDDNKYKLIQIKKSLFEHGANFVIDGIWQASDIIDEIEDLVESGITAVAHAKSLLN